MNNLILGLKFAVSYFTIIPIKFDDDVDLSKKEVLGFMVFSLPFIGLLLSLIVVFIYNCLNSIPILGSIISASLYMVLYGFIHTEAIIDVVDAIYAKHSGKDPYEVIKEPTIGAIGTLYVIIFLIIKISAISFLLENGFFTEFVLITFISRLNLQFLIYFFDFKSSFVSQLKDSFKIKYFYICLIILVIYTLLFSNLSFIFPLVLSFIFALIFARFIKGKLGFFNGDCLGAVLEFLELTLFIIICYIYL